MNLFLQGLRRSGTTITYDVLSQDPRLDLYYEPFSAGRVGAKGGGSGMQDADLMQKIRDVRAEFVANRNGLDPLMLNYGAPRHPSLEFDESMPDYCTDYLRFLIGRREHTVCKFTRMYRKAAVLKAIDPSAHFVLLVREPKFVVASYLYGRNKKRLRVYRDRKRFFTVSSDMNAWNNYRFFEEIVARKPTPLPQPTPDWMRILVLWKYTFDEAYRLGRQHFGDQFHLLRHEDLVASPEAAVQALYGYAGLPPSDEAVAWAVHNVRAPQHEVYEDDERWAEAYEKLDIPASQRTAGYDV